MASSSSINTSSPTTPTTATPTATATAASRQYTYTYTPIIASDFRFKSARKLVENGRVQHGAVNMFRVLYNRAMEEFGEDDGDDTDHNNDADADSGDDSGDDLNIALVSYELGFSSYLLISSKSGSGSDDRNNTDHTNTRSDDDDDDDMEDALEYMAKACRILYRRSALYTDKNTNTGTDIGKGIGIASDIGKGAISQSKSQSQYEWIQDQIPRVLIGIGDVLTYQHKHSQAVELYLNAVPYREEALKRTDTTSAGMKATTSTTTTSGTSTSTNSTLEEKLKNLKYHRLWVEVHVLIAEGLLRCPKGQDVLHQYTLSSTDASESISTSASASASDTTTRTTSGSSSSTSNVIVKAKDRISLAKGYYEQAKEQLQEVVYKMAKMEEESPSSMPDAEKQSICHLATMLMEVGMSLAQSSEEEDDDDDVEDDEKNMNKKPCAKKMKQ